MRFDQTFDSAVHEYYYNMDERVITKEKKDGYKKANSLSSYKYFLILIAAYEYTFKNLYNEVLEETQTKEIIDPQTTNELLHTGQKKCVSLTIDEFIKLLYNVKLAEGYSVENISEIIQETLFVTFEKYMDLNCIDEIIAKEKEETKKNFN